MLQTVSAIKALGPGWISKLSNARSLQRAPHSKKPEGKELNLSRYQLFRKVTLLKDGNRHELPLDDAIRTIMGLPDLGGRLTCSIIRRG